MLQLCVIHSLLLSIWDKQAKHKGVFALITEVKHCQISTDAKPLDSPQLHPGGTGSTFIKINYRTSSASTCVKPMSVRGAHHCHAVTLQACHSEVFGEGTFTEVNGGPGAPICVCMAEKQVEVRVSCREMASKTG